MLNIFHIANLPKCERFVNFGNHCTLQFKAMPFKKGQSGNPTGKEKGTTNHRTRQWEALGEAIRTRHAERFNQILDELPPDKFADMFLKVMEYFEPKLARTEMKHEGEVTVKQITGMEVK